ncbi:MAG: bifunctional diguanylate cyclase/phosphodiesterase [Gammaproteobacteria bacterium]|nr:MAG: bifunctional diguanylate cyclase/phosphodiesterase [Gammaproteobacteria bacterium]
MKRALQIISIQHELAMAIGNGLDLDEMLQSFMRVSIARLDLSSANLFLFCNEAKEPIHLSEESFSANLSHYMSIPVQYKGKSWAENKVLKQLANVHMQQSGFVSVTFSNERFYQSFSIPEHGVIIFESVIEIEPIIQKSLEPIFKKLALSCYGCLAHQSLIKEMMARRNAEDLIAHQAAHDELTQLCNRRMLTENLKKSIQYCQEKNKFGALIFIDLNQFKSINDVMGHDVGDKMLKEVANRLKGITRGKDTVARFGGDEFIILLPDLGDYEAAAELVVSRTAARILAVIEEPFVIGELHYNVSCSMGYDIFSKVSGSSCDIIKNADLAMYEAKTLRQRTALRYQPSMSEKLNLRSSYVSELKSALKNNEFTLYYQPQYDFNHQIIGAEALLRWNNPKRMEESPDVYIPIAEDSELILAIGDWVLHESCRQLKVLQENGLPDSFKKLAINVSAKQLGQENFFESICKAIKTSGVIASQMAIEITENVLISRIHDAMMLISKLGDIGVDCAIDDFGTGYSSLSYLRRLPSSLIKIDRNFVRDIHKDAENRSIAKMIIALGENLDMNILAEGVESEEELQCLKDLGCHQYQGFYFSRPLPFDQFLELVKTPYLEAC